jgi:hypothetical protein
MSNMARSDEIDELVSSVRNLVAQKETGAQRKAPSPDRLILTPALRIDAPAPESPEKASDPVPAETLILDNAIVETTPEIDGTLAGLEAAVTAQAEDWEADGGESFDQATWAASAFQPPMDDSQAPAQSEAAETDLAPEAENILVETPPAETAPDAAIEEIVAELQTQVAEDVVAQHVGPAIDETALRETVLRILREELAGEMGERITRNVRKLVRREINRVLVSRDLD